MRVLPCVVVVLAAEAGQVGDRVIGRLDELQVRA